MKPKSTIFSSISFLKGASLPPEEGLRWKPRRFRKVAVIIVGIFMVLFAADIYFISSLYSSIKRQTLYIAKDCLQRADIQEMFYRFESTILSDPHSPDTLMMTLPLMRKITPGGYQVPDYGALNKGLFRSSAKNSNIKDEFVQAIASSMHADLELERLPMDTVVLDSIFRDELRSQGLNPDEVIFINPSGSMQAAGLRGLWEVPLDYLDGKTLYTAYISPLNEHIISQMAGIIIVSLLLASATIIAFSYLFRQVRLLRSIEEMKDSFVSNMTHELKTPIAVSYAANDVMLSYNDTMAPERRKRYLESSLEQLAKLERLVETILELGMNRFQANRLKPEALDLTTLAERVAREIRMKAKKKCSVSIQSNPDEITIWADPLHFSNVLANLLENAVKYSGDSVDITISIRPGSISVADNGIGIPKEALPYIFNQFYRVPGNSMFMAPGYGIGLYYVRKVLAQMGCSINVRSAIGEGSVFTISFPEPSEVAGPT